MFIYLNCFGEKVILGNLANMQYFIRLADPSQQVYFFKIG